MSGARILIVEDESIVAADLAGKLKRLGYDVLGIAGSGDRAVSKAKELRPDLVLMDIWLEDGKDGIEAAEEIREFDLPVVYLTAHSDPATLQRAKVTGPFGYIIKPFEERELVTQIELAIYKHRADRDIRDQREWFRITLSSIGDAVIATDRSSKITFINPRAESLCGWPEGEAIGRDLRSVFKVVNEKTGDAIEEPVSRVLKEGKQVALANHAALVNREGLVIPIEDSAAPIMDKEGKLIGVVLVFHDVTEKRIAEKKIARSSARYALLSETAGTLLAARDPQSEIEQLCRKIMVELECDIFINFMVVDGAEKLRLNAYHGLPAEMARNMEWMDFGDSVCGCVALEKKRVIVENITELNDERTDHFKSIGIRACCCHPLMAADRLIGTLSFGTKSHSIFDPMDIDIMHIFSEYVATAMERIRIVSQLKKNEENLRSILDNSLDVIFRYDFRHDMYDFFSPSCLQITGYGSTELLGMSAEEIIDHVHPEDRLSVLSQYQEFKTIGQGLLEFRWRHRSGEYKWISANVNVLKDRQGNALYLDGIARDYTESRKAAQTLENYSRQIREIIESIKDGFFTLDRNWCFTYSNDKAAEIFGLKIRDLIGLNLWEKFPHHLGTPQEAHYRKAMDCRKVQRFEIKDGSTHQWFEVIVYPSFAGISVYLVDITERKMAEQELAKQAILMDHAGDAFIEFDLNFTVMFWGGAAERIYGYTASEAIGKTALELMDTKYVERDRDEAISEMMRSGSMINHLKQRTKDGRILDIDAHATLLYDESGKPIGIIGINRDITAKVNAESALKESQEKYSKLFDTTSDGVWIHNLKGEILEVNDAYCRMSGYDRKELIRMNINRLEADDNPNEVVAHINKVIEMKNDRFESKHRRKDGTLFSVDITALYLDMFDGRIAIFVRDISQIKRTMEDLRRINEDLSQFAYVASHDLQEPLRVMSSFSKLLEKRYGQKIDADADDYIRYIIESSDRMQDLIDDLLVYSRAGKKDIVMDVVDCTALLGGIVKDLSPMIESLSAKIRIGKLPVLISDEESLRRIFQNLISNALKFHGNKKPVVRIDAQRGELEWRFSVKDNGIGIAPSEQEKIFQIFYRLHSRDRFPGTGVGLTICKKIVEKMGGKIWVESEPGKGATFHFTVPETQVPMTIPGKSAEEANINMA